MSLTNFPIAQLRRIHSHLRSIEDYDPFKPPARSIYNPDYPEYGRAQLTNKRKIVRVGIGHSAKDTYDPDYPEYGGTYSSERNICVRFGIKSHNYFSYYANHTQ